MYALIKQQIYTIKIVFLNTAYKNSPNKLVSS